MLNNKTAWILAGGAARAIYTAGSFYALCKIKIPRPDIIIACSGSAATSLCYVTGQHETIEKVWCHALSTKKFVNFLRFWKIVNIDYLIDVVLRKNNPIDMPAVNQSAIQVWFPLTNYITGKLKYFSNYSNVDLWEVLRAAKSVPIFTNLFSIKGNNINGKYYLDSIAASRYQLHIDKAIREGAKKILVFDCWHADDNPSKFIFSKILTYMRNRNFRKNQLKYIQQIKNFKLPNDIDLVIISPKEKLGMSPWEIENDKVNKVFQRGYNEVLQSKELMKFIERIGQK